MMLEKGEFMTTPLLFRCPDCDSELKLPPGFAEPGDVVECPVCRKDVTVPPEQHTGSQLSMASNNRQSKPSNQESPHMPQQFLSRCVATGGLVYVPFFVSTQLRAAGHDKLPGIEADSLSGQKVLCIFSSRLNAEKYAKWFADLCSQQGARGFAWQVDKFQFIAEDGANAARGHTELVNIARRLGASGFALDHPGNRMHPFTAIPLETNGDEDTTHLFVDSEAPPDTSQVPSADSMKVHEDAGRELARDIHCWFCKKTMIEDASICVRLYGNVRWKFKRIPAAYGKMVNEHGQESVLTVIRKKFDQEIAEQTLGDVFVCKWDENVVQLPRCNNCKRVHEAASASADYVFKITMLIGGGLGLGIGIIAWVLFLSSLTFTAGVLFVGVSTAVFLVLSAIIGSGIKRARKRQMLEGVLPDDDYGTFPPIQEKLAHGWKLGASPGSLEAWNWGLK